MRGALSPLTFSGFSDKQESIATNTLKEKQRGAEVVMWQINLTDYFHRDKIPNVANCTFQAALGSDVTGSLSHSEISKLENENVRPQN